MSEALTAVNVMGTYLHERFWPSVHSEVNEAPQPCFMPFAGLGQRIVVDLDESAKAHWLHEALARQTDLTDTHPSLSDRLGAMEVDAHLAPPGAGEAADGASASEAEEAPTEAVLEPAVEAPTEAVPEPAEEGSDA